MMDSVEDCPICSEWRYISLVKGSKPARNVLSSDMPKVRELVTSTTGRMRAQKGSGQPAPPSCTAMSGTRLCPSFTSASLACSPFVRYTLSDN